MFSDCFRVSTNLNVEFDELPFESLFFDDV